MATNLVNGAVHGSQIKIGDVVRFGMLAVNNALNYSDSLIDSYITPPGYDCDGPVKIEGRCYTLSKTKETSIFLCCFLDDAFLVSRVHKMSAKVANGLKYKASNGYIASKEYALQVVGQLQAALVLVTKLFPTRFLWVCEWIVAFFTAGTRQKYDWLVDRRSYGQIYGGSRARGGFVAWGSKTNRKIRFSKLSRKINMPMIFLQKFIF